MNTTNFASGLKILGNSNQAPRNVDGDVAYYEQGTRPWYRASVAEVEALGASGDYSAWCAAQTPDELPSAEAEALPTY